MTDNKQQNAETDNLIAISDIIIDNSDSSLLHEDRQLEVAADISVPITKDDHSLTPIFSKKSSGCRCCCCGWKVGLAIFFLIIYVIGFAYLFLLPFTFYCMPSLQREFVFFNDLLRNVTDPKVGGLNCTTVMKLPSDGNIELGTWIIPPASLSCDPSRTPLQLLATSSIVFLYAHGSGSSRGNRFRIGAYKMLITHLNATVVTFDYRGFGDSTPKDELPSVAGVVNDTRVVVDWILSSGLPPERLVLWGHSLGTSIVISVLGSKVRGIEPPSTPLAAVLEAPFTSFGEEISEHPMNRVYRYLPYFDAFILNPVVNNPDLNFDSLTPLPFVACPLLILHAEDDKIVPFHLGKRLYEKARKVQPAGVGNKTVFHAFEAKYGYGHNKMRLAPELPKVVGDFIKAI